MRNYRWVSQWGWRGPRGSGLRCTIHWGNNSTIGKRFFDKLLNFQVLLFFLLIASSSVAVEKYNRDKFGRWNDLDGNCLNTRHELLKKHSTIPIILREDGCLVKFGRWIDLYTGDVFINARNVDIDHLVPLKFAWDHGAVEWSQKKMRSFYNNPMNLFVVGREINREKSAFGPLDWLPPSNSFKCYYIIKFLLISNSYGLNFTKKRTIAYNNLKNEVCEQ